MLWSALILGFLGSFHCVGMCGPIAFLLPLDRKSKSKRILQLVGYHSGRLFTYAFLGSLFGLIGKSLNIFDAQQQISIIIGILMIVMVLLLVKIFNRYNFSKPIYALVGRVKKAVGAELKNKNPYIFFTVGFFNGLLPCGLVYMAIFGAIAGGSIYEGALYMVFFGLGTIPLMTTAIYLGNFLKGTAKKWIVKAVPVFVVLIGALFVMRGMGLEIKYISPSQKVATPGVAHKHSCH